MANIDHVELAKSRLINQYQEAETVGVYLTAVLKVANEVEQVFCDLILRRFIDTAESEVLNIIGDLVGQDRVLVDATLLTFFGFEGSSDSLGFSSLEDPSAGGRFLSVGEDTTGNVLLTDEEYRLFIRARIIKNITKARREDIIEMVLFVLGATSVEITEGDRSYTVNIGKALSANERALVVSTDLLPKPQGVRVSYGFNNPDDVFEFASVSDTLGGEGGGFSSVAEPEAGGTFSVLLV